MTTEDPQLFDDALAAPGSRPPSALGREAGGVALVLVAIFMTVCLVVGGEGASLVGPVGTRINGALRWFFGAAMGFGVPALVAWAGVSLFLNRELRWSWTRSAGALAIVTSACGLLALPGADRPEFRLETFDRAGALGTFLVEWEGLRLVGQFGHLGAALILAGLLLVGVALTANQGLTALFARVASRTREEEPEAEAEPEPVARRATTKAAAAPAPAPAAEEDHAGEPVPPVKPGRPSLLARLTARWKSGREERRSRVAILPELDEPTGWDEPADQDVAALARALEEHRAQERLQARLDKETSHRRVLTQRGLFDDPVVEEEEDLEEEHAAADTPRPVDPDEEEDGWEETAGAGEVDDSDEIIFTDHTAPMPVAESARDTEASAKAVGEGLAKLFPSRWPKEGVPAGANKEETAEELAGKSEARMFRRLESKGAPTEGEVLDDEADPLFKAAYDTRPFGVNGEPGAPPPVPEVEEIMNCEGYVLPPIEILSDPPVVDARMTREEVVEMSQTLVKTLTDFGIEGRVTEVHQGPVVTRFEFKPAPGIKVSRITGLEHDIAMAMKAVSVRILAPIPGKSAVGIELPNKKRQGVYLKELICAEEFRSDDASLLCALGKTIDGSPYFADLAKMPHLLIAGATGAGKSVCLNTIICSLLYRNPPDRVKLIMVDPKRVELSIYADIPHLIAPVVCDAKCAATALEWAVEQMEERYKKLVEFGVRNIDGYNRLVANPESSSKTRGRRMTFMPYMVIIVDELADLMLVAKADVEESIQRLAQMARAVGIHLILATQRPSVNVITGIIKANFPSRIAFQVSQKVDSRTILDANGAEALLGKGDMLFSGGGARKPIRIQGCFVSDEEVEHIASFTREQMGPVYEVEEFEPKLSEKEQKELAKMMGVTTMDDLDAQDRMVRGTNRVMGKVTAGMFIPHDGGSARAGDDEIDEALVRAAARLILETRKASVSLVQRRLKVGFARAGRLMDMLEEMGIVGEFKGSKPRDLIVDPEAALLQLDKLEQALADGISAAEIKARDGGAPSPAARPSRRDDTADEEDEHEALYDDDMAEEEYEEDGEDVAGIGDPNEPWDNDPRRH